LGDGCEVACEAGEDVYGAVAAEDVREDDGGVVGRSEGGGTEIEDGVLLCIALVLAIVKTARRGMR